MNDPVATGLPRIFATHLDTLPVAHAWHRWSLTCSVALHLDVWHWLASLVVLKRSTLPCRKNALFALPPKSPVICVPPMDAGILERENPLALAFDHTL